MRNILKIGQSHDDFRNALSLSDPYTGWKRKLPSRLRIFFFVIEQSEEGDDGRRAYPK